MSHSRTSFHHHGGFVSVEKGGVLQTTALEIRDGRIAAIYIVRNPDKLTHIAGLAGD